MSAGVARVVDEWHATGRELLVQGAATRVWERGEGAPVVCIHGVPVSAFVYRRLIDELGARGRRAIVFDLPGLGFADRPAPRSFDYRWSGLSAWTIRALDALELDRAHLVVHDIGGPIGFDLLRRAPERVASLTALNTFVRVANFRRPWTMEPFATRLGAPYLRSMLPWTYERMYRLQGVKTKVPSLEIRAHLALLRRGDGGRAFRAIMRGFERTEAFERGIMEALAGFQGPRQVIWGERDPALRLATHGEDTRAALGAADIVRLDAKHFVQEDRPAEIAERVVALTD